MKSFSPVALIVFLTVALTSQQSLAWFWSSEQPTPSKPSDVKSTVRKLSSKAELLSVERRYPDAVSSKAASNPKAAAPDVNDLSQTLPDIDVFKVPVLPRNPTGLPTVEIFSSTEKSTEKSSDEPSMDNWLNVAAREFNAQPNGIGKVTIRSIDSGVAYEFIKHQQANPLTSYTVEAYAPSNALWVRMAEASGAKMTKVTDSLVSNAAGIVIRKDKLAALGKSEKNFGVLDLIAAVNDGKLRIGYTNPFASSTGLNFMSTVIQTFADGFKEAVNSPFVIEEFRKFQKGVPLTYETTLQVREAVLSGATLDAMVMEFQTFRNTPELMKSCAFVPFGERHDNPLYAVGDLEPTKLKVLQAFAEFATKSQAARDRAKAMGFNGAAEYRNPAQPIGGKKLIQLQGLWKAEKSGGTPVTAIFLGDVSGSMRGLRIDMVRRSLAIGANFIRPENLVGLIVFDNQVTRVLPIRPFDDSQKSDFVRMAAGLRPEGGTSMYDGIAVALNDLVVQADQTPGTRPVLIVLTDGESQNDNVRVTEMVAAASALRYPIYIMGMDADPSLMEDLRRTARATGGDAFAVTPKDIESRISGLLNSQL